MAFFDKLTMKKTIVIIIAIIVIMGFGVAWKLTKKNVPSVVTNFEECVKSGNIVIESYPRQCRNEDKIFIENIPPFPVACTQEAKLCPDGSAVGRTGPNCEFAKCPTINPQPVTECKKDSDCPSGNLCYKNMCVSPIGRQCAGLNDTSCPTDFECVQGCGPPVVRYPDDTPIEYFCQLKGYNRPCPICLASDTIIDTPYGQISVKNMKIGSPIWTITSSGKRALGFVIKTSKTQVSLNHKMVKLILDDGRTFLVSPGHPTIDGRVVGDFVTGNLYDGALVISSDRSIYDDGFTYDILPSGETGFYFANKILLDSTLH